VPGYGIESGLGAQRVAVLHSPESADWHIQFAAQGFAEIG